MARKGRLSQVARILKPVTWSVSVWRQKQWSDLVLGAAAAGLGWWLVRLQGEAGGFYPITGGAAVALIAFVVAPVATLLTLTGGARARALDRRHRRTIIRAMAWAFVLSIALLAMSIGAGLTDNHTDKPVVWLRWLVVGTSTAALLSTGRLFWFFVASLMVRDADADRPLLEDRQSVNALN